MNSEQRDLLDLSDYAWQRLRDRLDGLDDPEYLWEPVPGCWSIRPDADGVWRADGTAPEPAPLTTLAWRIDHIADGVLAAERNATWLGLDIERPAVPAEKAATAARALSRLEDTYGYFRRCLEQAGDLGDPVGPVAGHYAASSRRSFILHELDELIHHGAEVALLRDLYRATRDQASGLPQASR